ncbi:MAG: CDP-diacylglycerol--serine O-phosphatidyltransferase [Tannerellaceae bacterium]|nr:CDP-diacylglycerol--serine O-phosphatidyltransferase [Tannerellaceae bacterium]MCD8263771.1 CDP-diacylglycerol--serine O-phosphatidyltransferase [Tannerellaceae bacterium]
MKIGKYIPNTITCLNLVAGCIATVVAIEGNLSMALFWIIIAAILDFFDGFAARLLHAYSPIGKDLDSLADMVSFGVAPGMILFTLLRQAVSAFYTTGTGFLLLAFLPYLAFMIPAFSALRLAKFNIDTRQATSFIGLPVPAHTLLWASIGYTVQPFIAGHEGIFTGISLLCAFLTSLLMVSEIPMFSLKIKSLAWKGNELRYVLVVSSLVFMIVFGIPGIAGAILLYILLSIFNRKS